MQRLIIGLPDTCPIEPPIVPINYVNAVERAGHLVKVLPYNMDREKCLEMLQDVDIILFMGGGDIEAKWFNQKQSPLAGTPNRKRDEFEMLLIDLAIEIRLPIFGICRGHQLINIALGGTIYQDLPTEYPQPQPSPDNIALINHSRPDSEWEGVHEIYINKDSRLYRTLKTDQVFVNSTHHQAIDKLGSTLYVTARSADNVIEAIESDTYPIAAVQFHPERLAFGDDTLFTKLFTEMLEFCSLQ